MSLCIHFLSFPRYEKIDLGDIVVTCNSSCQNQIYFYKVMIDKLQEDNQEMAQFSDRKDTLQALAETEILESCCQLSLIIPA